MPTADVHSGERHKDVLRREQVGRLLVVSWSFSMRSEHIDVSSGLPSLDKSWRFTDAAGHEHYWQDGYPTLRAVIDDRYWCSDCRDWHEDEHLECLLCGEAIVPGTKPPSMFREFIAGPTYVENLVYDDGREHREYVVMTAEDAEGLLNADTREATISRIEATQQPVSVDVRVG